MAGLVLAALAGLAALLAFSFLAARLLIHPPRRVLPTQPTPADVGLPFEWVTFASHDGLRLIGWLVGPEHRKPPIVLLHGYTDHKNSYLEHARFLYDRGFPTLLYDQRGHGESSPGAVSLGPLEAADVGEALRMLHARGRGERFVVWGISMGAATALLAAARSHQIAGIIAESSFERIDHVLADTIRLRFRVPSFPVVPLVLAAASVLTERNLFRVHIGDAVEALGDRPLLLVSGEEDRRMTPEHGRRLLARSSGPTEHLVVAGADHAQCWPLGKDAYQASALRLLELAGAAERDPVEGTKR